MTLEIFSASGSEVHSSLTDDSDNDNDNVIDNGHFSKKILKSEKFGLSILLKLNQLIDNNPTLMTHHRMYTFYCLFFFNSLRFRW